MRHADILSAPFGNGSFIVPKAGFSRIRLFGVPVLDNAKDSGSLRAQIVRNPGLHDLRFIEAPKWMFREQLSDREQIIFTIFDPTNAHTKKIIRMAPYLFRVRCRARRFDSRPILHQCDRCHKLGHSTARCTRPASFVRCRHCGLGHPTDEHPNRCPSRATHKTLRACDCPTQCFNCKDARKPFKGHHAYHAECPLRKMYRAPNPFSENHPRDMLETDDATPAPMAPNPAPTGESAHSDNGN
jgi:hypothetical protein